MSGGSVHFHSILVYLHTSTYRSISTKVVGGTIERSAILKHENLSDNDDVLEEYFEKEVESPWVESEVDSDIDHD